MANLIPFLFLAAAAQTVKVDQFPLRSGCGESDAVVARRLKIPVVTFVGLVQNPGVPRVMVDQAAIGRGRQSAGGRAYRS